MSGYIEVYHNATACAVPDASTDPVTWHERGLHHVATVKTDDLETAWALTENDCYGRMTPKIKALVTQHKPHRSNVPGDIYVRVGPLELIHGTPQRQRIGYRCARTGFEQLEQDILDLLLPLPLKEGMEAGARD